MLFFFFRSLSDVSRKPVRMALTIVFERRSELGMTKKKKEERGKEVKWIEKKGKEARDGVAVRSRRRD